MILQGFGNSMAPFFRPGEELEVEPFEGPAIRPGDVLVFRTHSIEPANFPARITHRLIRKLQVGNQPVYLTKGDNRLLFDPVVFPDQVVGRVVRAGRKDLRSGIWRWIDGVLAQISYGQAVFFHGLMCFQFNGLGGLRWMGDHRKRFIWFSEMIFRGPLPALETFREATRRQVASILHGIHVEPWDPARIEEMAQIWNQAAPEDATTPERLQKRLFSSPGFDASQCWGVRQGERLVGWGFSAVFETPAGQQIRRVERIVMAPEGWRSGAAEILFHRLCALHPSGSPEATECGWMPVPESEQGLLLSPEAELASRHGFQPAFLLTEMRLTQDRFPELPGTSPSDRIAIRSWQEGDTEWIRQQLQAPEYDEHLLSRHFEAGGRADRILLAVRDGQVAGISFWVPDEEVGSMAQVGDWIGSVAQPPVRRGYGFHVVVDERLRSQGIGSAMIREGSRRLFQEGCAEVMVWTRAEPVFERAGYLPQRKFLRMRRTPSS